MYKMDSVDLYTTIWNACEQAKADGLSFRTILDVILDIIKNLVPSIL